MSQDSILGKVKTLQRQLGKNIKFGQRPPNAIPMKKAGSAEASSEEDSFLTSPMEIVTQQDSILSDTEHKSGDPPSSPSPPNPPGTRSAMEEKVAPAKPSRPKRHFSSAGTIESVNLDAIPRAIARLDNSAAKHKLSVKPKNQRVSKKHRRLGQDPQYQTGSLESQPSLDQNGHPGEGKHLWHEEEPEPQDSREEKRRQEDYWRELEAKYTQRKAAERQRLEEQRQQALERRLWEDSRGQQLFQEEAAEVEEEELQLEAAKELGEGQQRGLEEQGCGAPQQGGGEEEEPVEAEGRRRTVLEEEGAGGQEERRLLEAQEVELPELARRQAERQLLEGPEQEELEAPRAQAQGSERLEEPGKQREEEGEEEEDEEEEEGALSGEELEKQGETETPLEPPKVEKGVWGAQQGPEEERPVLGHVADGQSPPQSDLEEEPGEGGGLQPARQREQQSEEEEEEEEQPRSPGPALGQPVPREDGSPGDGSADDDGHVHREGTDTGQETPAAPKKKDAAVASGKDRKVEELRWQEVDERQTMPRPYTFQVSSGGRQILFPKVNLSPVTPCKDWGPAPATQEPRAPRGGTLPSSLGIPHTAILVTGAQLCGPAVNLSQIKDTACKSLLGLSEDKRPAEDEPRAGAGKARAPPESGPGGATALAEWASIRSRILKTADGDREPPRSSTSSSSSFSGGDEPAPPRARCDSHSRGNVRRAAPANAKFSIVPAWQKFSDGGGGTPDATSQQSADSGSPRRRSCPAPAEDAAPPPPPAGAQEPPESPDEPQMRPEPADTTDGCKFAKDLPSFLVPSLPSPQRTAAHAEPTSAPGSGCQPDPTMPGGEEKTTPFGIKLRRTNYSLRFHCDQQAEQKKKKRQSSVGESMDGGTPAAVSVRAEKEPEGLVPKHGPAAPQEMKPAPGPRRDSAESPSSGHPAPVAQPACPAGQAPAREHDRAASKMPPPMQKPALAPKPASQTPPSSPLSKLSRPYLVELLARRAGKAEAEPRELPEEGQGPSSDPVQAPSPPPPEERKTQQRDGKGEVPEKKPASPPLSTSLQDRPSLTPEAGRKEKPVLQSRHSLDGAKLAERAETAQPLWVTLALQKQKGFREQQATREERKQAREAKQAEKASKEHVGVSPQPGSRAASLQKPCTQSEEKKPETAVSRLQRREQLKKANTLPTSVTVEISDSAPPAPLVKEVTKRFSTPDAAPVSTEPAWLALAKRKAKAWSDCPQIIK
uniref:capping protein-inhibiting regulator of actin dynamics isoform X3 n=1 Tax=Jaculus jaculus TaxID=51337 RepID=UPI001E1B4F10|nr:capping protein-inhibiting regulator of actin dynamics isoform X3 [Jaculus jaculus]